MSANQHKKRAVLDFARIIAAVMVIAVHTAPFSMFGESVELTINSIFGRFGVPYFFVLSGFFILGSSKKPPLRFLIKTSIIYSAAILIYIPVNIYAGHFSDGFLPTLRALLFTGTMYHLWYLPASLFGVAFTYLLLQKLGLRNTLIISILLYAIGLLGDSYYGLINQESILAGFYDRVFIVTEYTRNGLFFAPLFLVIGVISRRYFPSKRICLIGFATAFFFKAIESYTVHITGLPRHDSMYIFLPFCLFFLFNLLRLYDDEGNTLYRNTSMLVYVIHPMVIIFLRGYAKIVSMQWFYIENSLIYFVTVSLISILISLIAAKVSTRRKKTPCRAWVEIDTNNLRHNIEELKRLLPETCALLAVVKADAYGHGAVAISRILRKMGVRSFCVATIDEGIEMRKNLLMGEILVLGYTHPSRFSDLWLYRLTQTAVSGGYASELAAYKKPLRVHVKIDTGLSRYGERYENLDDIISIFKYRNLRITGMFSHFRAADDLTTSAQRVTQEQILIFNEILSELKKRGIKIPRTHIQNSYGIINYSDLNYDCARSGIAMYGVIDDALNLRRTDTDFRPVLTLKARIGMIKSIKTGELVGYGIDYSAKNDMRIALVTAGYADGVPRSFSDSIGYVTVNNVRAPVVGKVCMDAVLVDITNAGSVKTGDIAVILGGEAMPVCQAAALCGTIPNDILTSFGKRVKRIYI